VQLNGGAAAFTDKFSISDAPCVRERAQQARTALLVACHKGFLSIVQYLVEEAGSDPRTERDAVRLLQEACATKPAMFVTSAAVWAAFCLGVGIGARLCVCRVLCWCSP
jgi:hypothetical protein